jgi:hypothetical protein
MAKADLTAAILRAMLDYNPDNGHFTWRHDYAQPRYAGRRAGCLETSRDSFGYRVICFGQYGKWQEHRLAWLHHYGALPIGCIDHINGVPDDNRIANLRDVTIAQNLQNIKRARRQNASGYLGVTTRGPRSFVAEIEVNRVRRYIGHFTCPKAAHDAYLEAKRRLHSTCTI